MLYHRDIGFPKSVKHMEGRIMLSYSSHAFNASKDDRYGKITLPKSLNVDLADLVEIEVVGNSVVKGVYRTQHNDKFDLVIVILNTGFVKTVWLNAKDDKHRTLDHSKYSKP